MGNTDGMRSRDELFVVIDCCGRPAQLVRSRAAAARLLGDPARKLAMDRELIRRFLEGGSDRVEEVRIIGELGYEGGSHYLSIVPVVEP